MCMFPWMMPILFIFKLPFTLIKLAIGLIKLPFKIILRK